MTYYKSFSGTPTSWLPQLHWRSTYGEHTLLMKSTACVIHRLVMTSVLWSSSFSFQGHIQIGKALSICCSVYYCVCTAAVKGRLWLNRHSSCTCTTNVYKLDAYAGTGSILSCANMHLWCLVPVDGKWLKHINLASQDIVCTEWNR